MNAKRLACSTSLAGCLLTAAALAQGTVQWQPNQMQGMMTNASVGLIRKVPPAVGQSAWSSEVVVRSPGVVSVAPAQWSTSRFGQTTADHPDFSTAALLHGINDFPYGTDATWIEFGGISTGGDVCPWIDDAGILRLNDSWYFLSVTIARKTGVPTPVYGKAGSALRGLAHPERAILSYYAYGSEGITTVLVDSTVVEQTSTQLGYGSLATDELDAVDWGMGTNSSDPDSIRSQLFAPVTNRIYFSLTQNWLNHHPSFVIPSFQELNAGTIYCMKWLNGEWTNPQVAFTSMELFGEPATQKELDAISVYIPSDVPPIAVRRVVFSATPASNLPDELLGYDRMMTTFGGKPLKSLNNVLVSESMGFLTGNPIDRDNANGTCGTDPHAGVASPMIATPMSSEGTDANPPMGLAVYRSITGPSSSPVDRVDLQVTGIDVVPGEAVYVRFHVGFLTQQNVLDCEPEPPMWFDLAIVEVPDGAKTVEYSLPGSAPLLVPLSIKATLVDASDKVLRGSFISVLQY